jgi:Mn2+/Fe2+ NRAMP family transporter
MLQIVLAPILFIAQELTVRLGLLRGMGIVGLLKVDAGKIWAMLVAAPLLVSCFIGLLSEYSAIGQTMTFWGWPVWVTNSCITCLLLVLALSGSYNCAEKVGLTLGACQMLLFVTMFMAKPNGEEVLHQVVQFPFQDSNYIKLVTSNIGAVIMPWMLAYQQSAVCDKGLSEGGAEHLKLERIDTFVGSFLTQGVMAAMLVTVGAAIQPGKKVDTVDDLLTIFARVLGSEDGARWLLTFAIVGACVVAAIVQTLTASWVLEELWRDRPSTSLQRSTGFFRIASNLRSRPMFYMAYVAVCTVAFIVTVFTDNTVDLSILTEFINGVLMPPVIFALWFLAAFRLPEEHRLRGFYKWFAFAIFAICSAFCLGSIAFSF